jgi:putative addiction module component (TIGR02574 family)
MKADPQRIIDDALQLDPSARALIAETLLESLDVGPDFEVSQAWLAEVRRRCAEIENGAVTLIPGDQALGELRAKYGS